MSFYIFHYVSFYSYQHVSYIWPATTVCDDTGPITPSEEWNANITPNFGNSGSCPQFTTTKNGDYSNPDGDAGVLLEPLGDQHCALRVDVMDGNCSTNPPVATVYAGPVAPGDTEFVFIPRVKCAESVDDVVSDIFIQVYIDCTSDPLCFVDP